MSPAKVSIDEKNEQAELAWVDDKGDTDAQAPPGAQVTYGVDNPAVVTVDPQSGKLTPLAEGSASVTVSIVGPDGGPLLEPDGVTPFAAQPGAVEIVAGQAVGATLSIKNVPPTEPPAPPAPPPVPGA